MGWHGLAQPGRGRRMSARPRFARARQPAASPSTATGRIVSWLPDIDTQVWVYLIAAAVSVLTGIFGTMKSQKKPAPGPRESAPRPGRAAPQKRTSLPHAPQPTPPRPSARPAPRQPAPAPVSPRPHTPVQPARTRPEPMRARVARPRAAAPVIVPALEATAARLESPRRPPPPPAEPRRRPRPTTTLRRLVLTREGLQVAFVLGEIIAPPLALRDRQFASDRWW